MEIITKADGAPGPIGPYSRATISNGMVYCSGQIGLDPDTMKLVEGGVDAQAKRVMDNLAAVLKAAGTSFEKVVMTTIFLTDIADGKVVSEIYAKYINADRSPARQTIAVKALPMNALVEISVIAEK